MLKMVRIPNYDILTRRKVLKVSKIKDANYGCKDEGNDDGVSCQSVLNQLLIVSQSVIQL